MISTIILFLIIIFLKMSSPVPKCLSLNTRLLPITEDGLKFNGISIYMILIICCFGLYKLFGLTGGLNILLILYIFVSVYRDFQIKKLTRNKVPKETFLRDVKEGDVVLVCRGGSAGDSADITELYMYHVFGSLVSDSVIGHVGIVFRDNMGRLKVADVQLNAANNENNGHVFTDIKEFIETGYVGLHFWKRLVRPLSETESRRLTESVYKCEEIRHCEDCFSEAKIGFNWNVSFEDIWHHMSEHGAGCAENIYLILYVAGLLEGPTYADRIIPSSFLDNSQIKLVNNSYGSYPLFIS
jgi:hypothetical protein